MASLYLNPFDLREQAPRPLPKALATALLASVLLHLVLLAFHDSTPVIAPLRTAPLSVRIELVKPVEPAQEPRVPAATAAPQSAAPEAAAPTAAPAATISPAPGATTQPRDWQTAAHDAVEAFVVEKHNPFAPPPAEREAFAPSRVERADISALASEFKPVPGPRRMCGRMASIGAGVLAVSIPVAYACAPGEEAPGEIRDNSPDIPH